jgi:hypothetical protein
MGSGDKAPLTHALHQTDQPRPQAALPWEKAPHIYCITGPESGSVSARI